MGTGNIRLTGADDQLLQLTPGQGTFSTAEDPDLELTRFAGDVQPDEGGVLRVAGFLTSPAVLIEYGGYTISTATGMGFTYTENQPARPEYRPMTVVITPDGQQVIWNNTEGSTPTTTTLSWQAGGEQSYYG